jgi:hypothetical protein
MVSEIEQEKDMRSHWSNSLSMECTFQLAQANKETIDETNYFGSFFLLQFNLLQSLICPKVSNREIVNI